MSHSFSQSLPQTAAIIVAAGSSVRFGADKLTASVNGNPLITYSLKAFAETPLISSIVLVVSPERIEEFQQLIHLLKLPKLLPKISIIAGGNSRHQSVQEGMLALSSSCHFVAVHDGARPLITPSQIERVCLAAYKHRAAALALPVTDTLHRIDAEGYAQETIPREQLWSVQTPQVFQIADFMNIANHMIPSPTDEVSLLRSHGMKVVLIENKEPNLKVTYQADLKLVEAYLEHIK